MRKLRLVILSLIVACTSGVLVASAQQTQTPTLSCPAGYSLTDQYSQILALDGPFGFPDSVAGNFALADQSNVVLTVWSSVGHPEAGCNLGPGNDGGFPCDQTNQLNEEFFIDVDGANVAFVPDHGTDQWAFFGDVDLGTRAAGNHSITFRHSGVSTNSTPESVTYLVGLCTAAVPTPPPPTGDQGCTPGYWKQPHHLDSWAIPDQDFDSAFGLPGDLTGGHTLLSALGANGGGVNALLRHAAAALLNAYSSGVNYGLTVQDIQKIVQDAFATGDYESAKNALEALNERYCPLN